jgi:ABC-2 type transport system ATP-binding protein
MTTPAFVDGPTIEVDGASKWFGQKVAVSSVSCSFGQGITGLLGPNGAGKTTLLRLICGLAAPSEGTVRVLGKDLRRSPDGYRQLGLVPEEDAVYPQMTARQYLEYGARLSAVTDAADRTQAALEVVDLTESADRHLGDFSKGMRQRTKVAAALVTDPRVLILDEPLNGTDPVQRAHLIDVFRRLAADGKTVVVSSHVLAEVERMADRVLAMVDGKLAAAGDVTAIRAAMSDIPFRVRIEGADLRRLAAQLVGRPDVTAVEVATDGIHIETSDLSALGHDIAVLTRELDIRLTAFQPEDESLESVFRYLVRR